MSGGSGGADFVLVAFSSAPDSSQTSIRVTGSDVVGVTPPPTPIPGQAATAREGGGTLLDGSPSAGTVPGDHSQLRELERRELGPRIRSGGFAAPSAWTASAALSAPSRVPVVGELLSFNTQSTVACQSPVMRSGRVRAVSERAIVLADTLNPPGGFNDTHYAHYAVTFDTLVAPLAEANFGGVSDLDGNGRVILFYTQEVNRLTAPDTDEYVGGFFFSRDLFPRTATPRFNACASSNVAEILYLLVPDPAGTINRNERSVDFVQRFALTTLVHEYQHLINASQRLHLIQSTTPFEETWLNEGLSHLAEELLFYRVSGLQSGQNIGLSTLQAAGQRALDAVNRHQLSNLFRLEQYLLAPHSNSPYGVQDLLATRGATWHFLRYALDRRGGSAASILRPMVASQSGGYLNLATAVGGSPTLVQWFTDWSVALYADDRVDGVPIHQQDRSWNHASLFPAVQVNPYPIRTRPLSPGVPVDEPVLAGGSAYFRFGVAGGAVGTVNTVSGGGALPATMRMTLLRTR